jgi:hypothetical protein
MTAVTARAITTAATTPSTPTDCRSADGADHGQSREAAHHHQEAEAAGEQRPSRLSVRFGAHAVALLVIDSPIVSQSAVELRVLAEWRACLAPSATLFDRLA